MKNLEMWPIDKFIEYASNPRKNDHAVDKTAAAIHEFGFKVPIVAKSDGVVIDGHLRLKAAKKLKLKEIPVIVADDLTDAQIKAFRISVNQVSNLADWDMDLLKIEIEELKDLDFDIDILGFEDVELKHILDGWESDLEIIDGDNDSEQENSFTLKVTGYKDDEDLIKRDIDTILTKYNGAKCE